MVLRARKSTSNINVTGMTTSSVLYNISLSLSTGVELGSRVVDCATQLGTTWGSGKRRIKSTLHGVFCASFFQFLFVRSSYSQDLGWQGLRRSETHWHMGLGKSTHIVNHQTLMGKTLSPMEGSCLPRSPKLVLESIPWPWP